MWPSFRIVFLGPSFVLSAEQCMIWPVYFAMHLELGLHTSYLHDQQ